ncbi:MAG: phosphotransferase [Nostoc sp. S4]|nr:phosphotransferase [Nostoc sp. S4]
MKQKLFLNSQNIRNYLVELGFCKALEKESLILELIPVETKNFNLLVTLPDSHKLLVKQERYQQQTVNSELGNELKVRKLLHEVDNLDFLQTFMPQILHSDRENSIMILSYLSDYQDLDIFYRKHHDFSTEISSALGSAIATIHRETLNHQQYRDFLLQDSILPEKERIFSSLYALEEIGPEVFGIFPTEGFKFLALYQRYESLSQAIADLINIFNPCCLTHNDLKLCNVLLQEDWEQQLGKETIRIIDWELSSWGDPAYDLGTLIASYLKLWLNSLVVSKVLKIEQSLKLATVPLENLQPSIASLLQAYLITFPSIVEHHPDFLQRVVQFTGTALICEILSSIKYQKTFGNTGICMLQVAKSLVCRPEASLLTISGVSATELMQFVSNKIYFN